MWNPFLRGSYAPYRNVSGYKILLECGLFQSNSLKNDYKINSRRFDFKPSEIDYIFLEHLHIDHCGLIPRLYANGCEAKIIVPKGSKELFKIMAHDSAFIMSRDIETLQRKYKMDVSPIYTSDDANAAVIALALQAFQQNHAVEDAAVHERMQKRLVGIQL